MANILSTLRPAKGAIKKRKRIGRGQGSGHGGTSTKGHKGSRSRTGAKRAKTWFEGGQMPLLRRVPKFGFTNPNRIEFQIVNVSRLQELVDAGKISNGTVTPEVLYSSGAVAKKSLPIKILGNGELKSKLNVTAHTMSKSAMEKISSVGGTTTILNSAQ